MRRVVMRIRMRRKRRSKEANKLVRKPQSSASCMDVVVVDADFVVVASIVAGRL